MYQSCFFLLLLHFFIFYYLTNQVIYCILSTVYRAGKLAPWVKILTMMLRTYAWTLNPTVGRKDWLPSAVLRPPFAGHGVCVLPLRGSHTMIIKYFWTDILCSYRRRVNTKKLLWIWFCYFGSDFWCSEEGDRREAGSAERCSIEFQYCFIVFSHFCLGILICFASLCLAYCSNLNSSCHERASDIFFPLSINRLPVSPPNLKMESESLGGRHGG